MASLNKTNFNFNFQKIQALRDELAAEHKEHIRDIQLQHAEDIEAQLTTLQLKHDAELQQLQQQHELKVEQALALQRQELEKQHKSETNRLLVDHQRQIDALRNDLVGELSRFSFHPVLHDWCMYCPVWDDDACKRTLFI